MEDAVKGLVILVLTVGGLAGIWIGILYWRLSVHKKRVIEMGVELAKVRRELETKQAREVAEGLSDGDLASGVGNMLSDL